MLRHRRINSVSARSKAASTNNGTTDHINTDPMLGPLQDNSGPTFTHALMPGSPAIDKGKNFTTSTTDQRGPGFLRTFDNLSITNASGGDGTDIGAGASSRSQRKGRQASRRR